MKRLIFATLFVALSCRCMDGQIVNGGSVIIPIKGSPQYVQVNYAVTGVTFTPLALPAGYQVVCANSVCTVQAPVVTIPTPTTAAWISLKQASDPLIWCVVDTPLTLTYVPSVLHVYLTITVTLDPGSGVYPSDLYQDIQPGPQQANSGNGTTSALPPQWFPHHPVCANNNPGVVFPSNGLTTGQPVRTEVQVRVVF